MVLITKKNSILALKNRCHNCLLLYHLKRLRNDGITGKSLSEALIFASTNPKYDDRFFIDLPVQYMKTTSSEHVVYINCSECQNKNKKQCVYTTCSKHVMSLQLSCMY